jgi:hypothetical protein
MNASRTPQGLVRISARRDDVDITAENARDIGDRLALPQADFRLVQIHGVAAKLLHSHVEADARSQ